MHSIALRLTAVAVAVVMLATLVPASTANEGGSTATLAGTVSEWLATSAAEDELEVIVTFTDAAAIQRLEALAGSVERLESVPMTLATLSAAEIRDVASWPETRSVWTNDELELHLDEGTRMVKADHVWAGERLSRPYLGTGVGVAVLDTGVDTLHPDLPYGAKVKKNFYIAGNPLAGGEPQQYVEGSPQTDTEHGHGTHVSSTIAGTGAASGGKYQGVAPGADLYVFKVGAGASVFSWWAARAFDWVIANSDAHNIRVISNSWGGGGGSDYNPDDPINILSKAAYDNGIVTVFSAGNGGGPNTIGRNAVSPYVVSVAAANKDFTKASFSSTGRPGGDMIRDENGLYRPTITAPGVDISAARSSMGAVMASGVDPENPMYTYASGTSMSAPHVSGIVALMLEAQPALSAQNVIDILEGTAVPMPDYEQWEVGAGFADAHAAVRAAEKGRVQFPPSTTGKTPAYQLMDSDKWEGTVLPAGYALQGTSNVLADEIQIEVGSEVDAIYADIEWSTEAENVYLYLYDPEGREVESSAGLTDLDLDFNGVRTRTVATTHPVPGTWTLQVVGRVNTVTDYRGFYGLYREAKTKTVSGSTTTTQDISGVVEHSVDPVNHVTVHEFEVPEGTTAVSARIDWGDNSHDIDLYIYDATGKRVGAGATDNSHGPWEEAHAQSSDPMAPGSFVAGTWTVEVRGWLVTDPQEYTGTISVTSAGR
jgi:serine protease AprX